ncbi:hypothetical protein KTR9_2785 [Gordonia sp. KTR9]|nr:hypothetical protein KTR9_2785 [Gordonia sp. KTR9]
MNAGDHESTSTNLADVFRTALDRHDEVPVVYAGFDGTRLLTVRELHLAARSVAAGLARLGVRPDDSVAVQLPGGVQRRSPIRRYSCWAPHSFRSSTSTAPPRSTSSCGSPGRASS